MPVVSPGDPFPDWCAISGYEFFELDPSGHSAPMSIAIAPSDERQLVLVISGGVESRSEYGITEMHRRSWLHVPPGGLQLDSRGGTTVDDLAELILIRGSWEGTPAVGVFTASPDRPLEMHFHDFDEYWIIVSGHTPGYTDDDEYALSPGDVVVTGDGYEHGIPTPAERLVGVSFEVEGPAGSRLGHLHRGADGEPTPRVARL